MRKSRQVPSVLRRWIRDNPGTQPWSAMDTGVKQALRGRLHLDQQGLCCYCYHRIEATPPSRIEHIQPQTDENRFDWQNLALACDGGERDADAVRSSDTHCDVSKADAHLAWVHPYNKPVWRAVQLGLGGKLRVLEPEAQSDVEHTLHLNCRTLREARKGALRAWVKELPRDSWRARDLETALRELPTMGGPIAFQPLIAQWLERQLRKHQ